MPSYTPNFNDTNTVTAEFAADYSASDTSVTFQAFTAQGTGGVNPVQGFAVGSEFTIALGDGTQFTIATLSTDTVASTAAATITPALTGGVLTSAVITRVSKGTHSSVGKHTRLRNQGQI